MTVPLTNYLEESGLGTTCDGFGRGLVEAAKGKTEIVGLCADLTESVRMHWFREQFPERFVEMGVSEENMVGVSAGLALGGKLPVAASYATFSPGNSWGPLRASVCYSNLNVKLVGCHSGLSAGPDGPTHQGMEDIALTRVLPNMSVIVPCDEEEARKATHAMLSYLGPCYLRTGKHKAQHLTTSDTPFALGKALTFREGRDVAFIACGNMVAESLHAAAKLEQAGISSRVLNMHTIKPLDTDAIVAAATETKLIITVEEHQIAGGLGSAVAESLAQAAQPARLHMIGMQDSFAESGPSSELLQKYGLTAQSIAEKTQQLLKRV